MRHYSYCMTLLDHPSSCCGHDHGPEIPRLLAEAEAACQARGVRLTEQRREVLRALLEHGHPLGAYDLIEKLRPDQGRGPAPIAIYRALDFLQQHGLIHRLETLNAFIACPHRHRAGERIAFLICQQCNHVDEVVTKEIDAALQGIAARQGFAADRTVIEIAGTCRACQQSSEARAS
jgi:Fur family transcriptional regulator, zinc uptake regulator